MRSAFSDFHTTVVRFKTSDLSPQPVIARSVEIHGEHLIFLRSDGSLAALFVWRSWTIGLRPNQDDLNMGGDVS